MTLTSTPRLEWLHYGGGPANLQLLWRPGTPSAAAEAAGRAQPFVPVPSSALSPAVKLGLGRTVALHHGSSTSYQLR